MGDASAGSRDLRRAAAELAARLPDELGPFARIAYNYAWSWLPGGHELFASIDRRRFELSLHNPVRLLQEASGGALERAARDAARLEEAAALEAQIEALLGAPADDRVIKPSHPVAFLCAEYGVHVSLPIYAGGLGALAGDILKEASDERLPLVGVGLMYRKGYFRQRLDARGWQHEYWLDTDPERAPAAQVTGPDGEPLTITIPIYDDEVRARIWRVDVGRVPLLLLDSDVPGNDPLQRWITARLYESDPETRLAQYMLLGIGGVRALHALGIEPGVVHLNEGHAALAPLELALSARHDGEALHAALAECSAHTVFTTHTPVPAGNDTYPAEQATRAFAQLARDSRVPDSDLIALGQTHESKPYEPFGVTQAALRLTRVANAVSRRHASVAREMWTAMWPERAVDDVPIGHVTNGVHLATWIGAQMRALLDRYLGPDWLARAADPATWAAVEEIPDRELWEVRRQQRTELIEFATERSTGDRLLRGDDHGYVLAAASALSADVLTVGFARRVATYKRLELLMHESEIALSLLSGGRPVQLLLAGKAHPRDDEAKGVLHRLFSLKSEPVIAQRVVFLDDYDLATAATLVRGCDVWLNLPRPPLEASGTSGMKSAVNGGLQLSVLDGWWAEAYDGTNGWAIPGDIDPDEQGQDDRDADVLRSLMRSDVIPGFYDRDAEGLPTRWLAMMRASLMTIAPRFSAARMLSDYVSGPYAFDGRAAPQKRP
jgi:starch phosphorylase